MPSPCPTFLCQNIATPSSSVPLLHNTRVRHCSTHPCLCIANLHYSMPLPLSTSPTRNLTSLCRRLTALPHAIPLPLFAIRIHNSAPYRSATDSQHFATLYLCCLSISAPKQCSIAHCYHSAMRFFAVARLVFATPQLGISVPKLS